MAQQQLCIAFTRQALQLIGPKVYRIASIGTDRQLAQSHPNMKQAGPPDPSRLHSVVATCTAELSMHGLWRRSFSWPLNRLMLETYHAGL